MKYWKRLLILGVVFALGACATNDQKPEVKKEPVTVVVPMGATALSVLGLYEDENVTIDTINGSETLGAEFAKKDGYDIIIAPINLGAKLISSKKSDYVLDSVVTWGNLYVVGTDEQALHEEGLFAAFGEQAVPQKVLMSSLDMETIQPTLTFFGSANDVQAQLLTQKANVGMLAEPAATATIAKAKEKGIELKVLKDLQKEYQITTGSQSSGYPQAALFVKKGSEEKVAAYIEQAKKFANETVQQDEKKLTSAIEKATIEKLGVPSLEIVQKTWTRQNIKFVKAREVKSDITTFLKQFEISLTDEFYGK